MAFDRVSSGDKLLTAPNLRLRSRSRARARCCCVCLRHVLQSTRARCTCNFARARAYATSRLICCTRALAPSVCSPLFARAREHRQRRRIAARWRVNCSLSASSRDGSDGDGDDDDGARIRPLAHSLGSPLAIAAAARQCEHARVCMPSTSPSLPPSRVRERSHESRRLVVARARARATVNLWVCERAALAPMQ